MIMLSDENGRQLCNRTFIMKGYYKYSLSNTNKEGEIFFAYISDESYNFGKIFFGFLDENRNFSRGLINPVQHEKYTAITHKNLQSKFGKQYIYVISQEYNSNYKMNLMILDISDITKYIIKKHFQLGEQSFRENLYSIQVFQDNYAIIFARNQNDKYQEIVIDPDECPEYCTSCQDSQTCLRCEVTIPARNVTNQCKCQKGYILNINNANKCERNQIWESPYNFGIFMNLQYMENYCQNKIIQIEQSNQYSLVVGDRLYNIFSIFTFMYIGDGEIQPICLKSYENLFEYEGDYTFYGLQFGVINSQYMWIKGNSFNQDKRSFVFLANPQNCQVYKNEDDTTISYQFNQFGRSNIFHTYQTNYTVSLIASSFDLNENLNQKTQAVQINIGEICPEYCVCSDYVNCDNCVLPFKNIKDNCQTCVNQYYLENENCFECPKFCTNCINQYNCLSCETAIPPRNVTNQCECQDGYIQNEELSYICDSFPSYVYYNQDQNNNLCIIHDDSEQFKNKSFRIGICQ
ncbi:Insulin-like growth factor binding protein, N-terminal [Pseudocohnilembus persalinus]|uniref:Insulin-like growth factor binding protein, N-terminal n=1 Tax=Pseudocohnilembus persalinus TaxID=266149 RepID=A0A0V0R616_PSEPJ|nr:Insulin-like growth factor binding protein, N-terminal [Pseudocohnilembus persalinus]|eukprot:KRX09949.1 Insulin-like growth factor binding protein, N-terminal [Pseudocohnilembus persalinus]